MIDTQKLQTYVIAEKHIQSSIDNNIHHELLHISNPISKVTSKE